MATRSLSDLHEAIRPLVVWVEAEAPRVLGLELLRTTVFRSRAEQLATWKIGRDAAGNVVGKIVTKARPGCSPHEAMKSILRPGDSDELPALWVPDPNDPKRVFVPAALAVDWVFDLAIGPEQRVEWEGPWDELGALAKKAGLEWGGDWREWRDRPHFQLPEWRTVAIQAGWEPGR
jgi:hypothetical protein